MASWDVGFVLRGLRGALCGNPHDSPRSLLHTHICRSQIDSERCAAMDLDPFTPCQEFMIGDEHRTFEWRVHATCIEISGNHFELLLNI